MNVEKYNNKGLTGLQNLGNTCFMNSCLQALSHTYELHDILENPNFEKKINKKIDTIVSLEWKKLQAMMWNENCIIQPNGFVNIIQQVAHKKNKDIFTGFAQNDLPEFLLFIIDAFHNSINREVEFNINGNVINKTDELALECYKELKRMYEKDYSELLDVFYGIQVTIIKNLKNENLSIRPEPFQRPAFRTLRMRIM